MSRWYLPSGSNLQLYSVLITRQSLKNRGKSPVMTVHQSWGPLRPPPVRAWAYATAGTRCPSIFAVSVPSSFGICSALVYPRPPQAPMIKSSSLTRAYSPPPPAAGREWGVRVPRSRRVSPSPPRPRHPLRDFAKPGETPAAERRRRPATRTQIRSADAAAEQGRAAR